MADRLKARNRRLALVSFAVAAAMVGASFAAVPLYEAFCRVTGYGGTTQVATAAPEQSTRRAITIRFNADVDPAMPWRFAPAQDRIETFVGKQELAFYRADNPTARQITGTASFNVTPAKAGQYFNKVQCFCFNEQTLEAGAGADMPVTFFIDPAIADDPNLDDVTTITLSYTMFKTETETETRKQTAKASTDTDG